MPGVAATGLPSLADDSGLCVDALNGMPGRALGAMGRAWRRTTTPTTCCCSNSWPTYPTSDAGREFRCAVAFCATPSGEDRLAHGEMPGRVIRELRGSGGFGYDVVFVPDEQDGELTSAEMTAEDKDLISHRGQSLRAIAPAVVDLLRS